MKNKNKKLEKETKKTKKESKKLENKNNEIKKGCKVIEKVKNTLNKKWLIKGSTTILLIAIIIAIYIGVNLILKNVVLPEIDCTQNKIYSLSQETKDKLGNIDKEIKITLINYKDEDSINNFVERYKELNKNIKIEKINDLSSRSDLMQKYSLNATDNLIIVSYENNEKTLKEDDLYTIDYSTYSQIDKTEEALTNAIINVITKEKSNIYFMTSHLMYSAEYYQTIMQSMEEEANNVQELDILANGGIPKDCDCLIITTLKEDLTEQERDNIIEYINNGGKILLMCGPNITDVNLSNFNQVLDVYGVSIEKGVIFEGKSANMLSNYPDFIIAEMQSTSMTKKMNMTTKICLADAGNITFDEERLESLGVTYEILAKTSNEAYLRTNLEQKSASRTSEDSQTQECKVAVIATKKVNDEKTSKLVIYSNEMFAMDMPVQINGYKMSTVGLYNNKDMILNSIAYLNEKENNITIRKNYDVVSYTPTEQQHRIIMAIIFILPFVIIIAGIIIWQVRRRKK